MSEPTPPDFVFAPDTVPAAAVLVGFYQRVMQPMQPKPRVNVGDVTRDAAEATLEKIQQSYVSQVGKDGHGRPRSAILVSMKLKDRVILVTPEGEALS